jgi:hypothetical protein
VNLIKLLQRFETGALEYKRWRTSFSFSAQCPAPRRYPGPKVCSGIRTPFEHRSPTVAAP